MQCIERGSLELFWKPCHPLVVQGVRSQQRANLMLDAYQHITIKSHQLFPFFWIHEPHHSQRLRWLIAVTQQKSWWVGYECSWGRRKEHDNKNVMGRELYISTCGPPCSSCDYNGNTNHHSQSKPSSWEEGSRFFTHSFWECNHPQVTWNDDLLLKIYPWRKRQQRNKTKKTKLCLHLSKI